MKITIFNYEGAISCTCTLETSLKPLPGQFAIFTTLALKSLFSKLSIMVKDFKYTSITQPCIYVTMPEFIIETGFTRDETIAILKSNFPIDFEISIKN